MTAPATPTTTATSPPTTTPFRPARDLLLQYALYHRDRRNIVTHFIGIPMIVFGVGVLLARVDVAGLNLAWIVWALSTLWYLTRGNLALGVATSAVNGALIAAAVPLAAGSLTGWLGWGRALLADIEAHAGPTLLRDLARPAAR